MDARMMVVDPGDRCVAWGRAFRTEAGGEYFGVTNQAREGQPDSPGPVAQGYALPVEGLDFGALTNYREDAKVGFLQGQTAVVGRWLGDRLHVDDQSIEPAFVAARERRRVPPDEPRYELHFAPDEVAASLASRSGSWDLIGWSPSQPGLNVHLLRVSSAIALWANGEAGGSIEFHPWLRPS